MIWLAPGLEAENRFILGPMAGVTDAAFRTVCMEQGAGLCYTEMVSAKALTYRDKKTASLLALTPKQRPVIAQIFGSEPDVMAEGARLALEISGADGLDINMGCPMPKITGNGEGSALMLDPARASRVIEAVRKAVNVPLSVKFRAGWDEEHKNAVEFARMAQQSGADFVCVHGRTRSQFYSGQSDRSVVTAVKAAVTVPVIASGDAFSPQGCQDILRDTGADAVMIARGAQGAPWIFAQCLAFADGRPSHPVTAEEHIGLMRRHVCLVCEMKGEARGMPEIRKHALWYLGRLRGGKPFKVQMAQVATLRQFEEICDGLLQARLQVKA